MTKNIFTFLLLLLCQLAFAQRNIDVLHYRYELGVSDKNDTIYGTANITAKVLFNSNYFKINLASLNSKGKGMLVEDVSSKNEPVGFEFMKDTIFIKTPFVKKNDTIHFTIKYKGVPANGLIISRNKYGNRTFFGDNWPNRAHHWIPCIDDPADKAAVDFLVTAPAHYKVVSNGLLQSEKPAAAGYTITHWKETVPLPVKVMVIGIADFVVQDLPSFENIPVTAWSFPQNATEAIGDYGYSTDILKFFNSYIAPYPFKKLANIQSKTIFGGMENASAIFYFENSVNGLKNHEDLVAHEIAHQWFGNMATEKSFAHLWLSEGFATYLTHLYLEKKYGKTTLQSRLAEDRDIVVAFSLKNNMPVVDAVSETIKLLNANSYQKGGWVLHMLRNELGDSIFHTVIKKYYAAFTGKNATTQDFIKIAEQVSGKNLSQFFKQWLYTAGQPKINFNWNYAAGKLNVSVNQLQDSLFVFPLEILIKEGTKERLETLKVNKKDQSFSFTIKNNVTEVLPDPNINLLFSQK